MSPDSFSPELILWTDPQRAPLAGQIIRAMGSAIRLIGMGGPRGGDSLQLALNHSLPRTDDLRKLLVEYPATYLLLASADAIDPKLLVLAMNQGTTVLALEPIASLFEQIVNTKAPQGDGKLLAIPAFTFGHAWVKAGETHDILGSIRLIAFESTGPVVQQTLHARLAEAWQVVSRFAAMPESIDASLIGPLSEIPEDPRAITGHLTAHARLPRGASAQVTLCDQTSTHQRRLVVIGDQGRLIMTDTTYQLYGEDTENNLKDVLIEDVNLHGDLPVIPPIPKSNTDIANTPNAANTDNTASHTATPAGDTLFAQLAAAQWQRLIEHPDHPWTTSSTQDQAANLACQLASLLSARTGQSESPGKMAMLAGK